MVGVTVLAPATTANLGPGFDCLGMALRLYNNITIEAELDGRPECLVRVEGEGQGCLPTDETNLVVKAAMAAFERAGFDPGHFRISMVNRIPLSRGLGSSASAIVGGIVAASAISKQRCGRSLTRPEVLSLATGMEGHPDNVAAAIYGGLTITVMDSGKPVCMRVPVSGALRVVVAVPDFELSTLAARKVLPEKVRFGDAVYNVSRAAMLVAALCEGKTRFLKYALEDRLHQAYRKCLIPGFDQVLAASRAAGAYGVALSGAGPSIMALTNRQNEGSVEEAMRRAFNDAGVRCEVFAVSPSALGARVVEAEVVQ